MSMAEPRNKQKWSKDPRGTTWSQDKSKFGFKMLEKMGWSEGAGLGANNDGRTDHVKVRNKRNNLGIGASQKDVDFNWLQTQDTFSTLLKDLNKACGTENGAMPTGKPKSVIESAVVNRKRGSRLLMFQSRFKKSKDLSGVDESDMAQILGSNKKRPDRLKEGEALKEELRIAAKIASSSGKPQSESDLKTVTRKESINDYFAMRLAAKKAAKSGGASSASADGAGDGAGAGAGETSDSDAPEPSTSKKKRKGSEKTKAAKKPRAEEVEVEEEAKEKEKEKGKKKKKKKKNKDVKAKKEKKVGAEDVFAVKATKALTKKLGREPTTEEVAKKVKKLKKKAAAASEK